MAKTTILVAVLWSALASADYYPNGCPQNPSEYLLLPHESDCTKFYQCSNGDKILQECPAGLHFDDYRKVCNWPGTANCQRNTCSDWDINILLPDPTGCGKFYQCSNGQALSRECPPGLFFNPDLQTCDLPENVECRSLPHEDVSGI